MHFSSFIVAFAATLSVASAHGLITAVAGDNGITGQVSSRRRPRMMMGSVQGRR